MKHLKLLFFIVVILNILDVGTTITFLEYDISEEGNPLMVWVLEKFGYLGMFFSKAFFISWLGLVIYNIKEADITKFIFAGMYVLIVFYTGVVMLNSTVILSHFSGIFLI